MGKGFSKMKKQARMLEEQFEKMRVEKKATLINGTSGNGLVTVVVNGDKELQSIQIKPECIDKEDVEGLQDLIKAACDNAYQQIQDEEPGSALPFSGTLPLST